MSASSIPAAETGALSQPANWREVLAVLGYFVKGRPATCPMCAKAGLAVSVLERGCYCHRDKAHFRTWAELVAAGGVPMKVDSPAGKRQRIASADPERVRRMLAREAAANEWTFAKPAPPSYPYLLRKCIPPMGARVNDAGKLLVPVYGLGKMGIEILSSLERIGSYGDKRFATNCPTKSGYCFLRPDWESVDYPHRLGPIPEPHSKRVWVAEGFATAATVALATGEVSGCVFSAGNLGPALEVLTVRLRGTEFIIAADNDRNTPGNPGLTAAMEAARRFNLRLA